MQRANQYPDANGIFPVKVRYSFCPDCRAQALLGDFEACKGTNVAANRNRLMQRCARPSCLYTFFHTEPGAILTFAEAEVAARHYNTHAIRIASIPAIAPAHALNLALVNDIVFNPPPHVVAYPVNAPQNPNFPLSLPSGTVPIPSVAHLPSSPQKSGLCFGLKCIGRNTAVSKKCLYSRCCRCCDEHFREAKTKGEWRVECALHAKRPAQQNDIPLPLSANQSSSAISAMPVTSKLSITAIPSSTICPLPLTSAITAPLIGLPATESSAASPALEKRQLFSNSVGPNWSAAALAAQAETEKTLLASKEKKLLEKILREQIQVLIYFELDHEPLRYRSHCTNYPFFSLAKAAQPIIEALSITSTDFLLYWSHQTQTWEHHTISTSLDIRGLNLLIYKLIRKYDLAFPDDRCPGLIEELEKVAVSQLGKRKWCPEPVVNVETSTAAAVTSLNQNELEPLCLISRSPSPENAAPPGKQRKKHSKAKAMAKKTGPEKSRQWPKEFYYKEVVALFHKVGGLQKVAKCHGNGSIEAILARVSPNCQIRKTTYNDNKLIWKNAPELLKKTFDSYGSSKRAMWYRFRRAARTGEEVYWDSEMDDESGANDEDTSSKASLEVESDMDLDLKSFLGEKTKSVETPDLNALKTCPFCLGALPKSLSANAMATLKELLLPEHSKLSGDNQDKQARTHVSGRGMQLHISFCGRHIQEKSVENKDHSFIPNPVDYTSLPCRIAALHPALSDVIASPATSTLFLDMAWSLVKNPIKTHSCSGQWERMYREHCGYYGQRGAKIIYTQLLQGYPVCEPGSEISSNILCTVDSTRICPLSYTEFLSSVLVPQTAIWLIQQDQKCSVTEAIKVWQSTFEYGSLFNSDEDHNQLIPKAEEEDVIVLSNELAYNISKPLPTITECINQREVEIFILDD